MIFSASASQLVAGPTGLAPLLTVAFCQVNHNLPVVTHTTLRFLAGSPQFGGQAGFQAVASIAMRANLLPVAAFCVHAGGAVGAGGV